MEGDINGDGVIDIKDIQALTKADKEALYKKEWWDRYRYGQLDPQFLADKLFTTAINMGAGPANRILQRALCAFGWTLAVDGSLGPATFQAVRMCVAKNGPTSLLATYKADQAGYYRELVAHNAKFQKYLGGWLVRAYS